MSDILITGGTGLIGSTIKNGKKLSSKDGDLRKWEDTIKIFKENNKQSVASLGRVLSNDNINK